MNNRDEDLRHLVQAYEMRINKAKYAISEEARLSEELMQKKNEFMLQKRKMEASADLHEQSIRRGQDLLTDIDRDISTQMVELSKARVLVADADLELQFLQDKLIDFKEKKQREE